MELIVSAHGKKVFALFLLVKYKYLLVIYSDIKSYLPVNYQ